MKERSVVITTKMIDITFLGNLFGIDAWNHTQHQLNAIFTTGAWVDAYKIPGYKPLYTSP